MVEIAPFGVEEWLNKWEKSATYDISQSTIASLTMKELSAMDENKDALSKLLLSTKLDYGWIEGSPAFKRAVAKLYDHVDEGMVLQTNGATGANLLAIYSLVKPGDHVIAEFPSYQQLFDIPKSLGAKVDYWFLHEEEGWRPDLTELAALVTSKTKLICLNNANNPTGTVLDREFLSRVVEIAREVNAYVLVDEVYHPLVGDEDVCSIVDLYERGIATDSLSKTYSVPGIRIGWIVTNHELADRLRSFRDYTMICNGVPNDLLATYVLDHRQQVLARNRRLVEENWAIYKQWLKEEPLVSLVAPAGVSTSFPRLAIKEDTISFCKRLLKGTGVLLVPGEAFDAPSHVRLGYCVKKSTLEAGLARLSIFLHSNRGC